MSILRRLEHARLNAIASGNFTIYLRFYLREASHRATSAAFRSGGKTG